MTNINKQIIRKQFDKHLNTYESNAIVQQEVSEELVHLLKWNKLSEFNRVLEVGCGTGFLTRQFLSECKVKKIYINDFTSSALEHAKRAVVKFDISSYELLYGDAEFIPFPTRLNAVLSTSTVQWFKSLPQFFSKVSASLNPDGIFAFSTFGDENLREIRTITGIGLDYKTLNELTKMLETDFDIIALKEWKLKKVFEHPTDVLRHMKYTGVNGIQKVFFGKKQLSSFISNYKNLFSTDEQKVILTYNPIIIIAKRKYHEQKSVFY